MARLSHKPQHLVVKESTGEWNWRSIVFSDDSRFCLSGNDDESTRVWRRPVERHLLECIRPRPVAVGDLKFRGLLFSMTIYLH